MTVHSLQSSQFNDDSAQPSVITI